MIRRLCILLLSLLLSLSAMAQPRLTEPEMFVGIYGGASLSTVFFTPKVGTMADFLQWPLAPAAGFVFRYGGHKVCSLQLELGYAQRGWHEYSSSAGYDYTRRLDYINLPILSHIHFGGKYFQAFINLGPEIAYCFRSTDSGTKQTSGSVYQYRPIDHPFDWGIAGGLGFYGIAPKVGVFQFEARVHYSFGSIYNNSRAEHFAASNMFYLSINLAYLWQIK